MNPLLRLLGRQMNLKIMLKVFYKLAVKLWNSNAIYPIRVQQRDSKILCYVDIIMSEILTDMIILLFFRLRNADNVSSVILRVPASHIHFILILQHYELFYWNSLSWIIAAASVTRYSTFVSLLLNKIIFSYGFVWARFLSYLSSV